MRAYCLLYWHGVFCTSLVFRCKKDVELTPLAVLRSFKLGGEYDPEAKYSFHRLRNVATNAPLPVIE